MSLSVLVDQDVRWEGTGVKTKRIMTPPAPEKLKAIRELVAAVTGLNPDRGDQIVVETLPFEATLTMEAPNTAAPSRPEVDPRIPKWLLPFWSSPKTTLVGTGAVACCLLVFAGLFFFLRKGKSRPRATSTAAVASLAPAALNTTAPGMPEAMEKQMESKMAEQAALQQRLESEALQSLTLSSVTSKKAEVLLKHLRDTVQKDSPATTNVLRTWLSDPEGKSLA